MAQYTYTIVLHPDAESGGYGVGHDIGSISKRLARMLTSSARFAEIP